MTSLLHGRLWFRPTLSILGHDVSDQQIFTSVLARRTHILKKKNILPVFQAETQLFMGGYFFSSALQCLKCYFLTCEKGKSAPEELLG